MPDFNVLGWLNQAVMAHQTCNGIPTGKKGQLYLTKTFLSMIRLACLHCTERPWNCFNTQAMLYVARCLCVTGQKLSTTWRWPSEFSTLASPEPRPAMALWGKSETMHFCVVPTMVVVAASISGTMQFCHCVRAFLHTEWGNKDRGFVCQMSLSVHNHGNHQNHPLCPCLCLSHADTFTRSCSWPYFGFAIDWELVNNRFWRTSA